MEFSNIALIIIACGVLITIFFIVKIVPTQEAYVVERLGKYAKTLGAGFHIIAPFIDRIPYKHSLKEITLDVPPQTCITKDNIAVEIDGVLYYRVIDPVKASYGIGDFQFAITQPSR